MVGFLYEVRSCSDCPHVAGEEPGYCSYHVPGEVHDRSERAQWVDDSWVKLSATCPLYDHVDSRKPVNAEEG